MTLQAQFDEPVATYVRPAELLAAGMTVGEALDALRARELSQGIVYFYVVDDSGLLQGLIPTRRLLGSQLDVPLSQIMEREVISVASDATMREAAEQMRRYHIMAIPVVDSQRSFAGVVDLNMLGPEIAAGVQSKEIDAFQLLGVRLELAASLSPLRSFSGRFPWLLANIAGGIFCAMVVDAHQPLLRVALVLALFIPVVLALSESVSIQAMTIALQSIHNAEPDLALLRRAFLAEAVTALLLGLGAGTVLSLVAYVWHRNLEVSLALLTALILSMLTACLAGFILPHVVHKLRGDPTVAAGPLALVIADVGAITFYLNMAGLYLKHMSA